MIFRNYNWQAIVRPNHYSILLNSKGFIFSFEIVKQGYQSRGWNWNFTSKLFSYNRRKYIP